jgi:hypothetical protein
LAISTLMARPSSSFLCSACTALAASSSFSNSTNPYPSDRGPRAMIFVLFLCECFF